ncbi:hypothetical protein V6N11_067445 [Hibiscus sabdariffa]|uniref:Uncharacterized protein n=1 Tax=Hibiscus sabdariffa TaxID=183260 RepID=A0ABR2SRL7_9ROSI
MSEETISARKRYADLTENYRWVSPLQPTVSGILVAGGLTTAIVSKTAGGRNSWNLSQDQPSFGFTIEATDTFGTCAISPAIL